MQYAASRQASQQDSAPKKSHGGASAKDKAKKVLLDSEAGTSGDLSPRVRNSFLERRYSPSTGMEFHKWQIVLEQFMAIGMIVKEEDVSVDSE
jgi:hypothetical protein